MDTKGLCMKKGRATKKPQAGAAASARKKNRLFDKGRTWGGPFLSAILLVVIQPPLLWFPLAFLALVPLLDAVRKQDLRFSFLAGYVTGMISYLGLIYWVIIAMHNYGGIDIVLSAVILILFCAYLSVYTGLFTFVCAFLEKRFSVPLHISAPIVWVLTEYGRGTFATGFPWSYIAYSQQPFLPFIQIASVTGTYFISFLIVAVNAVIYCLWRKRKVSPAYAGMVGLLCVVSLVYGAVRLSEDPAEGTKSVAIIQGNIAQDVKWDAAAKEKTIEKYVSMTIGSSKGADLIVWPETAMPFLYLEDGRARSIVDAVPRVLKSNLLFGSVARNEAGQFHNAAYAVSRTGEPAGVYNKVHLVPFGEYTPLASSLPFLARLTASGGDFSPGEGHKPLAIDEGNVGVLICYEGVFPSITRKTVLAGAQVLVNLTNDAWYNRTSAAYQHFGFYAFRAIETDRYVLRAANTGISGIFDPRGRVVKKTALFTEEIVRGRFEMRNTQTLYVRFGDYFIVLILGVLAVAIIAGYRHSVRTTH